MKVEYGTTTLGDDAVGDFITPEVSQSHAREIQVSPVLDARYCPTLPRRNVRHTISYTVDKEHVSTPAAVVHVLAFPDSLDDQAVLKVTEGATVYQMADACLTSAELVALTGRSTLMRFTFTGGQLAESS